MHLYFVAAEPSGDVLAAEVIDEITKTHANVSFSGVGGACMKTRGVESLFDTSELAVFGLLEGIKAFDKVKLKVEETAQDIVAKNPDGVVLVDSWGFMWRLAKRIKELGYNGPRIKLIGPQVWATRPGRAKTLAENVDHLLCIHDFEVPFYSPHGLATTVIGNPALDRDEPGNREAFREAYDLTDDTQAILMLLGSRKSEIINVAPVLVEAARRLCAENNNRKVICVVAGSVKDAILKQSESWDFPYILIEKEDQKLDAFSACDIALACSGTVTTEVALQGVPLVVGYKIGWGTWLIARLFLMKSKYITLINVAANEEVSPEFIQTRFTASKIIKAAKTILAEKSVAKNQIEKQNIALSKMGRGGERTSSIAAKTICQLVTLRIP